VEEESVDAVARNLGKEFGLEETAAPLIVAGSTHQGEEQMLLQVLQQIRCVPELQHTRLLLAPRHPERFDAVAQLIARSGFEVRRRSDGAGPRPEAPVLLLDSLGELAAAYRFATVAFVGGTLVRRGGHSIMEPAIHAKAIVIGPSMDNFRQISEEFLAHNGIRQISAEEESRGLQIQQLLDVFRQLLQNEDDRNALGAAALSILERNRGAARRTGEMIISLLEEAEN
jgi:3-deoxy-D-manno-octulosonic-acid transferase